MVSTWVLTPETSYLSKKQVALNTRDFDDSCAIPTIRTLHIIQCAALCQATTLYNGAGEAACYQAKAPVTHTCSTSLAGLIIVQVFAVTKVYAAACSLPR